MKRMGEFGEHCLHPHPSPGSWACCRCRQRSSGMPGHARSQTFDGACVPRLGRRWRHRTENWMFTLAPSVLNIEDCPCGERYCPGCRRGAYLARKAERETHRTGTTDRSPGDG